MVEWNPRANELFLHAAELADPAQRAAFVNVACAGDNALRLQVNSLLAANAQAGSFMERASAETLPPTSTGDANGTLIGPYKLLQKIGEGGMGSVWIAEQEKPVKRRVALKLIRTGMDTVTFLRRFEAERQALALMDHSHIAKVLDAGSTADGRPYFVMEFIKGIPITRYCDELHLTLRQRLELFVPVCQAIQHAHQKGIIHRDIKPSNILVAIEDGQPSPKIIDFGVAKALHQPLTEGTLMTEFGAVVGTLEYMSPEQAELSALDVDTRADVYALGVLLYELLTGSTPLDKQRLKSVAIVELLRVIKEEEPPKPSTRLTQSKDNIASLAAMRRTEPAKLQKDVSGELDWIVMRCLEKDRTRRYESPSALAADVQRHLSNEPVLACPPSAGYRLQKWAARNKVIILFVTLIWSFLLIAFGFSLLQWIKASDAEASAVKERDEANEARRLSNEAVKEKSAALNRSEARRLATLAMMKAATEPELTGPLLLQAMALDNDAMVASTALAALTNLPKLVPFQIPPDDDTLPGYRPTWWFTFLPDGKHVLVPSGGGERVVIYEAATGKMVRTFLTPHEGTCQQMFVSGNGAWLVSLQDHFVSVYDIASGQRKLHHACPSERIESGTITHDGRHLALIVTEGPATRDPRKPLELLHQILLLQLPEGTVKTLASTKEHRPFILSFNRDGSLLAAMQQGDHRCWLYDVNRQQLLWMKDARDEYSQHPTICISPDNRQVLAITGKSVIRRDARTGDVLAIDHIQGDFVNGASSSLSPDGRWLMLSPAIHNNTLAMRGGISSNKPVCVYDLQQSAFSYAILDNNKGLPPFSMASQAASSQRVITLHGNEIAVWDRGDLVHSINMPGRTVDYLALSPDGRNAVIQRSDESLHTVNLDYLGVIPARAALNSAWCLSDERMNIRQLQLSPRMTTVSRKADSLVTIAVQECSRPDETKHGPPVHYLLADGTRILSVYFSGHVELYDALTSRIVKTLRPMAYGNNSLRHIVIPRAGGSTFLIGYPSDRRINGKQLDLTLMDVRTGDEIMKLDPGFAVHDIRAASFSTNGRWLALQLAFSGGNPVPPRAFQLWDLQSKRLAETIPFPASDHHPDGVTLRPDGQSLITWDAYGRVHQWTQEKRWQQLIATSTPCRQAILTADGKHLATYHQSGEIHLWETATQRRLYTASVDPKEQWEIQFTTSDTMLLAVCANKLQSWPVDLAGYVKQQFQPLTRQQREMLGLTATRITP